MLNLKATRTTEPDSGYVQMTSTGFFPLSDGKYAAKKLYCPCGGELYGEAESLPVVTFSESYTPIVRGRTNPYYFYECLDCGFYLDGDEARLLHLAFVNDLI